MATDLDIAGAKILNFSEPLDVAQLDATVAAFYGAASNQEVRGVDLHASTIFAGMC